ncbi:glycosyltransferase family 1 protein [Lentzea tibetensis]|uniref:Glycosyltransferase family 1 protein n=1 Tax=Lentzea tibetensis TaxID=2591470 RepID=A0A563EQE4_9PSEU|nr:glycosyltransferase [Lentzea tibetensis]TWP49959.1 glycosyltransferase family 1 protein [Lentzea tibetensis]
MRVLFSSTAGAGHFGPLVPFVRSCLRAGNEVMVAAPAALAPAVSPTGATFWPFDDPPPDEMGAVMGGLHGMSHDEANRTVVGEIFGRLDATAAVPRLLTLMESWRPDLVVRESAEFGSAVAAELHSVPVTRVGIGLGEMEDMMISIAAPNVDALRRSYRLPSDPDGAGLRRSRYFTLFPAGIDDHPATRFRDPSWMRSTGADPFVYVTFGSVAGGMPHVAHVYAEALTALAGLDAEVLLTVGRGVDPDAFGTPPPNVRVEQWVDQASVLTRATAVVCHGGGGTTVGALAAGVPLVIVPLFAEDQHVNARHVAAFGAGLFVAPADIRSAVDSVLEDGSYRAAARALADEIAEQPSTEEAFA